MNKDKSKSLIVITGASSGIGAATAQCFSKQGYPLLLIARRLQMMEDLKLPNCLCKQVDVTIQEQLNEAIKEAEKFFDCKVDCIVNNAGVMYTAAYDQLSSEDRDQMIDLNIKGLLNGITAVLASMKERKTGTIINISSVASRASRPYNAVYSGTKYFVNAVTEGIRQECTENNIRFLLIEPGFVETELMDNIKNEQAKIMVNQLINKQQGGLTSETIADAISFVYNQPQFVSIRELCLAKTSAFG